MLSRHTLPVWMLADALIVIGIGGGILAISISAPLLRQPGSALDVASMKQQLIAANQANQKFDTDNAALRAEQAATIKRLAELDRYQAEASVWIENAVQELGTLKDQVSDEQKLRKDLLGLRGDLSRTLFVVDVSYSMGQKSDSAVTRPNWGPDGDAWTYVRNQVNAWLTHLPVSSFRVICFNRNYVEFPTVEEQWVSGEVWRSKASKFLEAQKPDGFTFTERAIERALAWHPTTIILFTDGAPSDHEGQLEPAQQDRIKRLLASQQTQVPINVVALNHYFDPQLGAFLLSIAASTGGGFVGL